MKYFISKTKYQKIINTIIVFTLLFPYGFAFPTIASASFNAQINYQGKLTNSSNVAVSDGTYHMKFRLYTTETGGVNIWEDDRSTLAGNRVSVTNGLFSVLLGSSTALTSVDFNQDLWLEVLIGGTDGLSWETLSPRKKLGAVPAAFESDKLDGLSSEQFLRSDASNSTSTSSTFLSIIQNGAGKVAEFFGPSSASVLSITSTGRIGIGSTTPNTTLSVNGNSYISGTAFFGGAITATSSLYLPSLSQGLAYVGSNGLLNTTASSSLFGFTPISNSLTKGYTIVGDDSGTAQATSSIFISSTGNVGVGTSTPYVQLDMGGVLSVAGGAVQLGRTSSTFKPGVVDSGKLKMVNFSLTDSGGTTNLTNVGSGAFIISQNAVAGDMSFQTGGTNTRMTITSAGLVGIGTTTPNYKLVSTSATAPQLSLSAGAGLNQWVMRNEGGELAFATSTYSATSTVSALRINTNGQIQIPNLSTAGFVKSSATGILSVDTNTYLTSSDIFAFPFTVNIGYNSTTTTLGLLNGFFSTASSTISSSLFLPSLSQGFAYVGSNGLLNTAASSSLFGFTPISNSLTKGYFIVGNDAGVAQATSSIFISSTGNVGIGSTTPFAKFSVAGESLSQFFTSYATTATSTLAGGLSVNNGAIQHDWYSGVTSIDNLALGNMNFEADAGQVTWIDMPVTSYASIGTIESYISRIDGNPMLTIYSESDGAGGTQNRGVGIGTTTPLAMLSVQSASSTRPLFDISSSTGTSLLRMLANGYLGIGTTSPFAKLSINSEAGINSFSIGSSTGTHFTVDKNGNVGIGTTSPSQLLTVGNNNQFTVSSNATGTVVIGTPGGESNLTLNGGYSSAYYTKLSSVGAEFTINTNAQGLNLVSTARSSWTAYGGGWSSGITMNATNPMTWIGGPTFVPMSATFSNTAGNTTGLKLSFNYNQVSTSTANNTDLLINRTETSLGVGTTQLLFDTQVGGNSKFNISNTGQVYIAGNVGIGTTSPYQKLSVAGNVIADSFIATTTATSTFTGGIQTNLLNIISSTATSTFANGIALSGGCFSVAGNCLTSYSDTLVNAYIHSSTTIPKTYTANTFTALQTLNGGLTVSGNTTLSSVAVNSLLSTNASGVITATSTPTFGSFNATSTNATSTIAGGFAIGTNKFVVDYSSGNVGIGTSSPQTPLHVYGSGGITLETTGGSMQFLNQGGGLMRIQAGTNGGLAFGSGGDTSIYRYASNTLLTPGSLLINGNVGIGTTSPFAKLSVSNYSTGANTTPLFVVASSTGTGATSTAFIIDSVGNVGIGSSTPNYSLSVGNNFGVNSSGTIMMGGYNILSNLGGSAYMPNVFSYGVFQVSNVGSFNFSSTATAYNSADTGIGRMSAGIIKITDGSTGDGALYVGSTTLNNYFGGKVGIGTTTPTNKLTITDTSASQLSLSAGAGLAQWAFRNAGGNFYLSTTTVAGTATTTLPALSILNTNGYVGIGTTSPSARLSVKGGGTTTGRAFAVSDSADTERFTILDNGNVGVGTTTPNSKLVVGGNIKIVGWGGGTGNRINFVTDGDSLVSYIRGGWGGYSYGTENPSLALNSSYTAFGRSDGSIIDMVIRTGNVGIGTAGPLAKLHAGTTVSDYSTYSFSNTGAVITSVGVDHTAARTNALTLMRDGTSGVVYAGLAAFDLSRWSAGGVNARTQLDIRLADTDTNTLTDVLSLRSNGNVGIGTTTPGAALVVSPANITSSTTPLFVVGTSTSSNLFSVDASGRVDINSYYYSTSTKAYGIKNNLTVTNQSTSTDNINTIENIISSTGNGIGAIRGSYNLASYSGNGIATEVTASMNTSLVSKNTTDAYGSYNLVDVGSTAVLGSAYGSFNYVNGSISTDITNAYGVMSSVDRSVGPITNAYGFYSNIIEGTNAYGIYIQDNITGSTNGYALYSAATENSYLAGKLGIGTTSPTNKLTITDTSASQLSLSAGAGINQWAFRNAGGNFYLSTTTVAGTATTSISALEISGSGFGTTTVRGLNISGQATTTSNVGINLSAGCFAVNGVCVGGGSGSGTVNSGVFGQLAFYGANGTALSGTSTITISTTTNSGRVGIATTTNLNATLTLQGASGLDILRIATSTSGSDVITISQWGGFVQKISSSTALSIQRSNGTPVFEVDTTSESNSGIDITASAGQSANLLNFYSSASTFLSGFTSAGGLFMNISSTTAINVYDGSGAAAFVVDSNGKKVGVGTSTLTYNFNVSGDSSASYIARIDNYNTANTADGLLISLGVANASRTTGNYFIGFSDGTQTVAGKIQGGSSAVAYTTTAADLAEYFRISDLQNRPEPGDIVMIDPYKENSVRIADVNLLNGKEPVGIISTNPGFVGNGPICFVEDEDCDENYAKYNALVAMVGQVPVKVSNENGEIAPGDYLTLSSTTPGHAVKLVEGGYVIGVAMAKATSTTFVSDKGTTTEMTVKVFIKNGWRDVEVNTQDGVMSSVVKKVIDQFKSLGLEIGKNFVKIANLIVQKITADRVETKELCIEDICVSKEQLKAMLIGAGQNITTIPNPTTEPDPEEPVIEESAIGDPVSESTVEQPIMEPIVENLVTEEVVVDPISVSTP